MEADMFVWDAACLTKLIHEEETSEPRQTNLDSSPGISDQVKGGFFFPFYKKFEPRDMGSQKIMGKPA